MSKHSYVHDVGYIGGLLVGTLLAVITVYALLRGVSPVAVLFDLVSSVWLFLIVILIVFVMVPAYRNERERQQ